MPDKKDQYKTQTMTFNAKPYMNGELKSEYRESDFESDENFVSYLWKETDNLAWKSEVLKGFLEQFKNTNPQFNKEQEEAFKLLEEQVGYLGETFNQFHGLYSKQANYKDNNEEFIYLCKYNPDTKEFAFDEVKLSDSYDSKLLERLEELGTDNYQIEKIRFGMISHLASDCGAEQTIAFEDLFYDKETYAAYQKTDWDKQTDNVALISKSSNEYNFVIKNPFRYNKLPLVMTSDEINDLASEAYGFKLRFIKEDIETISESLNQSQGGQ